MAEQTDITLLSLSFVDNNMIYYLSFRTTEIMYVLINILSLTQFRH